jgi:uncharacterized protein (TIGR02246 family)
VKLETIKDGPAIRTLWALIDHSWNQRDAEQFCRLFAKDASLEFVATGPSLEGRAAIRRHFADQFPRYPPHARHSTHLRAIHDIAAGVVAVDAAVGILGHGSAGEATRVLRKFIVSAVMLRTSAGWELRWMRVFPQNVSLGTQD